MNQFQIEQQTKQKNRKKLIQQNLRLQAELSKLQKEIQSLDDHFNKKVEQDPHLEELKSQIQSQQKQIRQIKESVDAGRQSNAKQNIYYIKKQEDELLWMKQQLQSLQRQKEAVHQGHQDKIRKLATNEPLLKHKEEIQKSWNDTKKQNRQISLKLVQLERQIRKWHALKQRSKDKNVDPNENLQLATLETEIARMNAEMKMKELKWKPNGQVLDNQFFTNKSSLQMLVKKLEELEKQEGVWKVRAAALRDHSQIMTDRQRLSKITTAPKPEPIIKVPIPIPKQKIKPPTLEMTVQKQIRDNIKNDKFVDLVRVSSTPAPNIKIANNPQTQLTRNNSLNKQHIKKESPKAKKQQNFQFEATPQNSNKNQIMFKRQKSQKQKKQGSVLKQQNKDEVLQANKNGNNWIGRRQKLKSKQPNGAGLAEIIRQKAEEVKKINQKLEEYQPNDRSVSSPKKKRDKASLERIKTHTQQNKSKIGQNQQNKLDIHGQLNKEQQRKQSPADKKKNKQIILVKQSAKDNQSEIKGDHAKILKSRNTSKRYKQQNLVEKIDISAKINSVSTEKLAKNKKENKISVEVKKESSLDKVTNNEKQQIAQQIKPKSPLSPKIKQKRPVFEIVISDSPTTNLGENSQIRKNGYIEDDTDGVPKIIRRKKVNDGGLVTTGTST